jgi:ABC-type uncharacterized transport system ATPase component
MGGKCELLDFVEGPVKPSTPKCIIQGTNVTQRSKRNRINIPVHILSPRPWFLDLGTAILISVNVLALERRIAMRAIQ